MGTLCVPAGPGWPQVPYTMVGPGKVLSRGLGTWINDPGRRTVSISFQACAGSLLGGARGWGSACARGPAENQTGTRLHGGTQRVLHDVFPSRPEKVAPDSKRGTKDLKSRQDAPCPGPPPGLSGVERVGLPEPEPRKADQTEMGPESPSWEVQLGQMAPSGKVPQSQCC